MEVFSKFPDNIWQILENDTYKCTKLDFKNFLWEKERKFVIHFISVCAK